jgi:putative spermidine/putrescine transport system permease protein
MMRVLGLVNLLVFLYLLGPLVIVIGAAFGTTNFLAFPPHGFTLHWFGEALANPRYSGSFATSLIVAAASTVLSVAIGLPASYALARLDFPGRNTIEAVLLMPLVLPALVLAIGLTVLFSSIGFSAGTVRLVVAHLVICTPYVIRVTVPVLRRMDAALEEAARNLGASPVQAFFLVTLPVLRPGAIAAATLAFVASFDELNLAIFLANPRAPTLPVAIYSAIQIGIDPTVCALSAILILLVGLGMVCYHAATAWRVA